MRINNVGISEIHAWLGENHRLGYEHFTRAMLHAWADEAEFQMSEGNPPTIELRAWDSIHGRTQTYTVSNRGVSY